MQVLFSSHSSSNGKGDQWNRSYKENDTYTAPTSDRVERLGYGSTSYGSVNVNFTKQNPFPLKKNVC